MISNKCTIACSNPPELNVQNFKPQLLVLIFVSYYPMMASSKDEIKLHLKQRELEMMWIRLSQVVGT